MADADKTPDLRRELDPVFNISFAKGELKLKALRDLNDRSWGAWFGAEQHALRIGKWLVGTTYHRIESCHLDLSVCRWADPLPLLSIGLSLLEVERKGAKVLITLPEKADLGDTPNSLEEDNDGVIRNRFLKFLAREGFLDFLVCPQVTMLKADLSSKNPPIRVVRLGPNAIQPNAFDDLKDLPVPLAYPDSTCVPARLLQVDHVKGPGDTKTLDAIDQWVDRMLYEAVDPVVMDKVPNWAQRSIKYRFLMILRETLHNVAEHAYRTTGYAAVYVRYREGALGQAPNAWADLEKFIKREDNDDKVPLMKTGILTNSFARSRVGFIEMFVIDAGRGLCGTLPKTKGIANPLHQSMLDVFQRWCSSKQTRATEYGGLFLIRLLLEPIRDFVRVRDNDGWWGTELPLPETSKGSRPIGTIARNTEGKQHSGKDIRGLAWTARLSWLERTDVSQIDNTWQALETKGRSNPIHSILQSGIDDISALGRIPIRDCRLSGPEQSNLSDFQQSPATILIVLPNANWMRNHIQEEISAAINLGCLKQNGCLIIGDIPPEEGLTYVAAVKNSKLFLKHPLSTVGKIVFVTKELRASVFVRGGNLLFNPLRRATERYVSSSQDSAFSPDRSLPSYFRLLRLHDAKRAWKAVISNRDGGAKKESDLSTGSFIGELVDWNDGIVLDGYLDFPQTLTHPICREIYSISLHRFSGTFPGQDCRYSPIDNLVESLVVRFNAQAHPTHRQHGEKLARNVRVGSIQVSGTTERSRKSEGTTAVHFFRHPSGTATGLYLLPWLAPATRRTLDLALSEQKVSPGSYRRVGRTPVIARDGWKAYLMPRFDAHGRSAYEQSPRESYRAWQESSSTPMKLGHWSYGGHHDFLTINLMVAFDTELDRIGLAFGGSLARYVFANLFRVFGLAATSLTQSGKQLCGAINNDQFKHLLPQDVGRKEPLLLYPSHPVTDHVLDRFLSLIEKADDLVRVRDRMLAVLPIQRNRGGSGLQISGLTIERLEHFAKTRRKLSPSAVFFDDAMISSRTYVEIKRLLRSKGFGAIYSISMLDRQRWPSIDHIENKDHVCFWRLDVPSMGGVAHCPLCRALGRIRDMASGIASDAHKRRLESWVDSWFPRNPTTQWGDSGLRPIPLWLTKPERKFGIVRDKRDPSNFLQIGGRGNEIQLSNTAGLVSWATELHSITSRDDLPIRVLDREDLLPEARIQLLSSQLLLFIGELDGGLAHDLGIRLLAALWDAEHHDRHTALAALTLIACGNAFMKETITAFLDERVRRSVVQNHPDQDLTWLNIDFVILLALSLHSKLIPDSDWLRRASRLLIPTGKKRDLLRRLHRETKDDQGKQHTPWLHRLRTWENEGKTFSNCIDDTIASAGQIREFSVAVDPIWLRPDKSVRKKSAEVRQSISKIAKKLEEGLQQLDYAARSASEEDVQDIFRTCRKDATDLIASADTFHEALFLPLGIAEMKNGRDCALLGAMQACSTSVDTKGRILAYHMPTAEGNKLCAGRLNKSDLAEAYVVWDSEIQWAIQEILTNIRHAGSRPVQSIWGNVRHQLDTAHQWVRVWLDEKHAVIDLSTTTGKLTPIKVVAELIARSPTMYSNEVFRQLGGNVDYFVEAGRIVTRICVPYAHTLGV